jgi:hypothetical protein
MKKDFDAVDWMREQRIRIDRETEALSWKERRQWIRKSLEGDSLWESLKPRLLSPEEGHRLAETKR